MEGMNSSFRRWPHCSLLKRFRVVRINLRLEAEGRVYGYEDIQNRKKYAYEKLLKRNLRWTRTSGARWVGYHWIPKGKYRLFLRPSSLVSFDVIFGCYIFWLFSVLKLYFSWCLDFVWFTLVFLEIVKFQVVKNA